MIKKFLHLYRVDNVPLILKPLFWIVSIFIGLSEYCIHRVLLFISRVEVQGTNPVDQNLPCIFAVWHSEAYIFFTVFSKLPPSALINHPYWYMKGTHIMLRLMGVKKFFLGSSGHGGKQAAIDLAKELRGKKYYSLMNPDGPAGPVRQIKKGTLHLAIQSGLPIVPIHFKSSPEIRAPSWDRKLIPLPFGKISVKFGKPIYVTDPSFEKETKKLKLGLDGEDYEV